MKNFYILVIIVTAMLPSLAFAFDMPAGLDSAVRAAWKNNPEIKASALKYRALLYDADSEGSLSAGELSVGDTLIGEGATDSVMEFSQPLEINGSRGARRRAALSRAEEERASLLLTVEDVSLSVKEAYWELAKLDAERELKKANVRYFSDLKKMIERQIEAGTLPGFHALRADAALSSAKQELQSAELEYSSKKNEFFTISGMAFELPNDFSIYDFKPETLASLAPDMMLVKNTHPMLMAPKFRAETAEKEIKAEKASMYPDVELIMRKETFDDKGGAGLRARLPLFGWGKTSKKIKSLQKIAESEREMERKAYMELECEMQNAVSAVLTYESIINEYDSKIIKNADELVRIVEKAYSKGASGFLDLIDAKKSQTDAHLQRASIASEYLKAFARLEKTYGIVSEEYSSYCAGGKNE